MVKDLEAFQLHHFFQRYCKGIFTSEYKKTIGVDFLERQLRYGSIL